VYNTPFNTSGKPTRVTSTLIRMFESLAALLAEIAYLSQGAQISLEVKIETESEQGISRDTLDLKIKETLNQIGASVLEEKEE